jgi:phosphatidylserine/phosphatidylglycerophosphate/cardiolipin synthase-like enzyme
MIDITELRDGGQDPASVAAKIASFLSPATRSLELALYDVHLESANSAPIHAALAEVLARKVQVRLVYNVDFGKEIAVPPPPVSRPELVEALPVETRSIPGVPDLMHHKYVVRDGEAVLTGSTNWTDESWSREENMIAILNSKELAARYLQNFEELWQKRDVERSGHVDSAPIEIDGHRVRPWFAPGHGEAVAHRHPDRRGDSAVARQAAGGLEGVGATLFDRAHALERQEDDALGAGQRARLHARQDRGGRRRGVLRQL